MIKRSYVEQSGKKNQEIFLRRRVWGGGWAAFPWPGSLVLKNLSCSRRKRTANLRFHSSISTWISLFHLFLFFRLLLYSFLIHIHTKHIRFAHTEELELLKEEMHALRILGSIPPWIASPVVPSYWTLPILFFWHFITNSVQNGHRP